MHEGFDPLSSEFLADPYAVMASLPAEAPVFYAPSLDYYVITRYADVEAIFRDPRTTRRPPRSCRSCRSCPRR